MSLSDQPTDDDLRGRLYTTMDDEDLSVAEKQRQALAIGRAYLDVDNGNIQRYDESEDVHTVVASVGGGPELLPTGATLDRATTYCRRTIEETSPIALSDAPEQGWADDPAYEEHGFDCYLGTTIFVGGDVYGTVCFVSRDARERRFTGAQKAFVELIARLLGRELEASQHHRRIRTEQRKRKRFVDRYESLVELAPDAIFLADAETGDIVDANRKATELTGYSAETLRSMQVLALHPSEDRDRYERLFRGGIERTPRSTFDDGTPLLVERADGSQVPVEMSASTVELDGETYVHGIVRDISDRRAQERELRVKDRAIDEASVGVTIADATDSDLPLVYANREFERITGYDTETAVGRNCRFLQGPATETDTLDTIRTALADREPVTTEILNYRADGTPFWNELTIAPVRGESGESVTHFLGFQRDVTDEKRRERLITVLNRVLRHNLRNSMSVIGGNAEAIAERADNEVADIASQIATTAGDLTALSEKAQTLESIARDPAPLEVRDAVADVRAVLDDLRDSYPGTEFAVDVPERCRVEATSRLRVALRECIENAAEHGSSTVTVDIETADEWVRLRVRDGGPGLSEQERRVLETGQETPLEHGDGLGLWLVNWVITGIGGEVAASVDDGTTVTIRLPAVEEGAAVSRPGYYRQAAIATSEEE